MNQPDLRSAHAAFLSFLIRFAAMLAAACAVFLLFSRLPDAGRYVITPPSFSGRTPDVLREAIVSQFPALIELTLLFLSAFTVGCRPISLLLCIWRGCSLGCFIALFCGGRLIGFSPFCIPGLTAYFLASAAFAALSAYSVHTASLLVNVCADGRVRRALSLGGAYLYRFLSLSGVVLLCGLLACALI